MKCEIKSQGEPVTCPRCQGCLVESWNVELRISESRCLQCGHYPAWPTKTRPEEHRGEHERESRIHSCSRCGRPKVPWRRTCAKCSIQMAEYHQRKSREEQMMMKQAARKAMEG